MFNPRVRVRCKAIFRPLSIFCDSNREIYIFYLFLNCVGEMPS